MIKIKFIFIIFLYLFKFIGASVRSPDIKSVDYTVGDLKLYFTGTDLDFIVFNQTNLFEATLTFHNTTEDSTSGYYILINELEVPYIITIENTIDGRASFSIFVHKCLNDCSNNGICNMTTLTCSCNQGWGGTDCSIDQTFECKNNCSGNGICSADMTCSCNQGYNGVSCDQFVSDLGLSMKMNKSLTSPSIVIGSFDMKSSNKSLSMNKFTKSSDYNIFISYIQEVDIFSKVVAIYNLTELSWSLSSTNSSVSIYETQLSLGSKFTAVIELISNVTQREWANQVIVIPANSIKYSIKITNYTFSSNLNRLEMFYQATPNTELECIIKKQQIAWGAKKSTDMHWVTLPNNQLQLYGKFSNYLIADDKIVSISNEGLEFGSTIQVKVNIPFFKDYVELDPDFSVLVDVNMDDTIYDECGVAIGKKSNRKWVIPVAVIVSVVGATVFFVAIFSIAYKKNMTLRTKVLSFKSKINSGNNGGVSMK